MLPEDVTEAECEVWPENEAIVGVFLALATQWRHGMDGITGLDYSAIWTPIRIRRVPRNNWRDLFAGIQVMERAVLEMTKRDHG